MDVKELIYRIQKSVNSGEWSIYKLSETSGLPYTTVRHIVNGTTRFPQACTLERLADVLGIAEDSGDGLSREEFSLLQDLRFLCPAYRKPVCGFSSYLRDVPPPQEQEEVLRRLERLL